MIKPTAFDTPKSVKCTPHKLTPTPVPTHIPLYIPQGQSCVLVSYWLGV